MDNITHTFVGAALAEAGLKKRTALGSATLMIGANFPDIDVIAVAFPNSIDVRRGVTHGFLALAILPFVLAALMAAYDRFVRRRRDPAAEPADVRQLVILSAVSILTHPTLDYMNVYGMRWLMPFVNRWFYADGLFIIDVWLLAALVAGVVWSRRARATRPARLALVGLAAYTTLMLAITEMGRTRVRRDYPDQKLMVAPVEIVPWHRDIMVEDGDAYRLGRWSAFGGLVFDAGTIPKNDLSPEAAAARLAPEAQGFLNWSRFPFYRVYPEANGGGRVVRIADARFTGARGLGWATVDVRLP